MKQLIIIVAILLVNVTYAQERTKNESITKEVKHLKLYPKEADKYVNIYVEFDAPTDFDLRLPPTELNNEKTWTVKAKETYQTSMDVTNLPNGVYTIIMTHMGQKEVDTFIVKRK